MPSSKRSISRCSRSSTRERTRRGTASSPSSPTTARFNWSPPPSATVKRTAVSLFARFARSLVQPDPHERHELVDVDRLGDVVRRPRGDALLAIALHGLGGQGDDGKALELTD